MVPRWRLALVLLLTSCLPACCSCRARWTRRPWRTAVRQPGGWRRAWRNAWRTPDDDAGRLCDGSHNAAGVQGMEARACGQGWEHALPCLAGAQCQCHRSLCWRLVPRSSGELHPHSHPHVNASPAGRHVGAHDDAAAHVVPSGPRRPRAAGWRPPYVSARPSSSACAARPLAATGAWKGLGPAPAAPLQPRCCSDCLPAGNMAAPCFAGAPASWPLAAIRAGPAACTKPALLLQAMGAGPLGHHLLCQVACATLCSLSHPSLIPCFSWGHWGSALG